MRASASCLSSVQSSVVRNLVRVFLLMFMSLSLAGLDPSGSLFLYTSFSNDEALRTVRRELVQQGTSAKCKHRRPKFATYSDSLDKNHTFERHSPDDTLNSA